MIFFITDEDDVMKRSSFSVRKYFCVTTRQYSTAHTHTQSILFSILLPSSIVRIYHEEIQHTLSLSVFFSPLHLRNSSPTQSLLLSSSPCLSSFFSPLHYLDFSLSLSPSFLNIMS